MAQNQMFREPRSLAIAPAPSGRSPPMAVAPLATARARRTKSTMVVFQTLVTGSGQKVHRQHAATAPLRTAGPDHNGLDVKAEPERAAASHRPARNRRGAVRQTPRDPRP